jgi:hypothetical protein
MDFHKRFADNPFLMSIDSKAAPLAALRRSLQSVTKETATHTGHSLFKCFASKDVREWRSRR